MKIPGVAAPGIFCAFVGLLPVKPLAYVITNYTCCDRNYEGQNVYHEFHPLPDGRDRLKYYIIYTLYCQKT